MKKKQFVIKTVIFTLFLITVSYLFSCDENQSKIPNVYVDLTNPIYNDLSNIGGYVYVTGGVSGILVYHSSLDEYQAYERTCPYDPDCGKVYVDEINFNAVDSVCCGSEFSLLLNGTVVLAADAEFRLSVVVI